MERRKAKRIPAYRMPVQGAQGEPLGYSLDLSRLGLRISFDEELDLAEVGSLRLALPGWLELADELELSGRFVWLRPGSRPGRSEAGFVFEELPARSEDVLLALLARLEQAAREDGLDATRASA